MKSLLVLSFFLFGFIVCVQSSCSSSEEDSSDTINVTEHIWVNDEITERRKINVDVPSGSKLYDVMVEAGARNTAYLFDSILYPTLGHFITKIGDDEQEPASNQYWLIFITDKAPKKNNPPGQTELSPLGVSSLDVEDGKHYLFWLRTANFTHT